MVALFYFLELLCLVKRQACCCGRLEHVAPRVGNETLGGGGGGGGRQKGSVVVVEEG